MLILLILHEDMSSPNRKYHRRKYKILLYETDMERIIKNEKNYYAAENFHFWF